MYDMVNWILFWILAIVVWIGVFAGFWILDAYLEKGKGNTN
jgi:hypothetical protein